MSDQPAAPDCEHHYATRLRGGHPIHVRTCQLCGDIDWGDLAQQAAHLQGRARPRGDHRLRQGHHEKRNLWQHHVDEPPDSKSGQCVGRIDSPELAAEIVQAVNARRDGAKGPRCCKCGSTRVAYRNVYNRPFCWPCADDQPWPTDPGETQ